MKSPVNKPLKILIIPRITFNPPCTIIRIPVKVLITICFNPPNIIEKKFLIPVKIGLMILLYSTVNVAVTPTFITLNALTILAPFSFKML